MIRTTDTPLDQAPKALNRIGVGQASHILLGPMIDRDVVIAELGEWAVAGEFVCVDGIVLIGGDVLPDQGHKRLSLDIGDNLSLGTSATFHYAKDRRLIAIRPRRP